MMSTARHSPLRSLAAHAVLLGYTLIALFPVFVIVVNSFKNRRAIFADPLALPSAETFDPSDARDLAARIVRVLRDRAGRRAMVRRMRREIRALSWDAQAARILAVYDERSASR